MRGGVRRSMYGRGFFLPSGPGTAPGGGGPSTNRFYGAYLPELPSTDYDTTLSLPSAASTPRGSYFTPGVGSDSGLTLTAAIAAAAYGDVIVLQANTEYRGKVSALNKGASTLGKYVYVVSSETPGLTAGTGVGSGLLVADGVRVQAADRTKMARITSPRKGGEYEPALTAENQANHYRFIGIEFVPTDPMKFMGYITGNTLTVTSIVSNPGTISLDSYHSIWCSGAYSDTRITARVSGTGGTGTYTVDCECGTCENDFTGTVGTPVQFEGCQRQLGGMVEIGDMNFLAAVSDLPHHFIFDRCYAHTYDTTTDRLDGVNAVHNGMIFNGDYFAVISSRIEGIYEIDSESHGLISFIGRGPFKTFNSFIEAAGINEFYGGIFPPGWYTGNHADITARANHYFKRASWIPNYFVGSISGTTLTVSAGPYRGNTIVPGKSYVLDSGLIGGGGGGPLAQTLVLQQLSGTTGGAGTYRVNRSQTVTSRELMIQQNGNRCLFKNHFELKDGNRVLFDGNLVENFWLSAQRFVHAFTPRISGGSGVYAWMFAADATYTNNHYKNIGGGLINIMSRDDGNGGDYPASTGVGARLLMRNNLVEMADVLGTMDSGYAIISISPGGVPSAGIAAAAFDSFIFDHNSVVGTPTGTYTKTVQFPAGTAGISYTNLVVTNNVLPFLPTWQVWSQSTTAADLIPLNAEQATPNSYSFAKNVFTKVGASGAQISTLPTGNFEQTQAGIGFTNYAAGTPAGFALSSGSPYFSGGTNGDGITSTIAAGASFVSDGTPYGITNAAAIQ